jgi:hypothetical protein
MGSIGTDYTTIDSTAADSDDKYLISVDGTTMVISPDELKIVLAKSVENEQTGTTYTIVAADQAKTVRATHADAKTFTIPATSGFLIGCPVIIRNASATDLTLVADTGVTANGSLTIEQNASAFIIPRATNEWDVYISGAGGSASLIQLSTPTLTMTAASSTAMDFSWTNVSNESSYYVQIAEDSGFTTGVQTATPAADDNTHQFTGLTASTTYYGRVKAVGDGVTYSDSNYGTDDEPTSAAGYDADAQTFFTYVESTLGESITGTEKTAVSDWFTDMKTGTSPLTKAIAAHFIVGGAVGRKVNALNPSVATYRIVTNVGCTLDSTGITTDGVDDWFEMGLIDGTDLPVANCAIAFYNGINRAAVDSKYAFGTNSGSGGHYINIRDASDDINGRWQNAGDLNWGTSTNTNNHYLFNHRDNGALNSRRTTVGSSLVYNSSYDPAIAVPASSGVKMAFGAFYNDASGTALLFDNVRFAIIVVFNQSLTDAEETIVRTANTDFVTATSRT